MKNSRLYSFMDNENGFNLYFLEGQKLIHDIVLTHNIGPIAFPFYRNTVLSSQMMSVFLKAGEGFGVYIDSESPYFRFKIEMHHNGKMRTLLLPEEFDAFPDQLTGKSRFTKIYPGKPPYTSIIEMKEYQSDQIINAILKDSYQVQAKTHISEFGDQCIMISKLPSLGGHKSNKNSNLTLEEYYQQKKSLITDLLKQFPDDIEKIVHHFESDQFAYLHSKEIEFSCPCSKEQMISGLYSLGKVELENIFKEGEVELRCDYCNSIYNISKKDIHT
jgi:molecular chaperone Hsp33